MRKLFEEQVRDKLPVFAVDVHLILLVVWFGGSSSFFIISVLSSLLVLVLCEAPLKDMLLACRIYRKRLRTRNAYALCAGKQNTFRAVSKACNNGNTGNVPDIFVFRNTDSGFLKSSTCRF